MECKIIDEYVKARNNIKGTTKHDDFNYETEKELGKGKHRKINKILSSDTEDTKEEKFVKKSTKAVHLFQMCNYIFVVIFIMLSLHVHT